MRWNKLFDDLESQLEREISAEELDLDAEQERLRLGRLGLRDRLVSLQESSQRPDDYRLAVTLVSGLRLSIRPVMIGRDWLSADLLDDSPRRAQGILPLSAVSSLSLRAQWVLPSLGVAEQEDAHPALSARLGIAFVLRDLCRRRRALRLVLDSGELHGTIDRVGRDHLDLACHEPGSPRRDTAVTEIRMIPLGSLLLVRL